MNTFKKYKSIIIISCIGFLITGVIAYPFYKVHWDSNYAFTAFSIDGKSPANWMGWFYVWFWDILYRITGQQKSIGVFQNILYWVCMPLIWVNLVNDSLKNSRLWYGLFAFSPFAIILVMGITNNMFAALFMLCALLCHLRYIKNGNKSYLYVSILLMMFMIWARRDSVIFAAPAAAYTCYIIFNRKALKSAVLFCVIMAAQHTADKYISSSIPHYSSAESKTLSIDTLGLVMFYDLVNMSLYKNELLVPEYIIKPEYREEFFNNIKSQNIYDMVYGWNSIQRLGRFLESGTVWQSGLELSKVYYIYLTNIHMYIWLKLNMFFGYIMFLLPTLLISIISVLQMRNKKFGGMFGAGELLAVYVNDEPHGYFGREAEPTPANLTHLKDIILKEKVDIAFAQDPDADRLVVADEKGAVLSEELTAVLALKDLLDRGESGDLVLNMSTSNAGAMLNKNNMTYRSKVGEANVVKKIAETGAFYGIEGNGGVIYPKINAARDSLVGIVMILSH